MIRAIFFDLDGTLVDRASAHRRYCLDLIGRHPDAFPEHRRDMDFRALTADPSWDRKEFSRRVASAFPGLGLTAEGLARDHASKLATFVEVDPAVVLLLEGLARCYRLAVVSNGSSRVQRAKLARLGLGPAIPRAFLSGELGVAKPDPRPFRLALEWAGCEPGEALMVGDDPAVDVAGAAGVGLATCWVSGGRAYPPGLPEPDRTVARVLDLPGALG
jgi:putative hydrolase of the HAD superfamily